MNRFLFTLASVAVLVAACNSDTSTEPGADSTAPTVTTTTPASAATGVAVNSSVTATFSEAMTASTISGTTFELKNGSTAIAGTVTYSGTTATLVPSANLPSGATFTASISTAAKDMAGNALAAIKTWTFTTVDATAPTVASTIPASSATGTPRNTTVKATFSEAMSAATITAATFELKIGSSPVPGVVTYAGTTATLTPAATLAPNTVFTATISTVATDVAGNHLAAIKTWTFTTVNSSASGPAIVDLGTAINYVILAKSAVSTTGATAVVGDIGLSPAAASFITGFALSSPPTTFTTSAIVTGQIKASDYDPPTPANLTTAVLDMQNAYTDAAGRTLPDFTELGAGNIDGLTLVPGLYKWGTGVSIPIGVTLTGGSNDVWIFQVAQDLTVGNGAIVTLSGGAQAKHIFWQVAGQATLGTTSNFKGIILSQTLVALNTGATMTGRALAQTAVTLNATAITNP